MSARTNLILKDQTDPTPVDHTFRPNGDDANGVHQYWETGVVPAGRPTFTISLNRGKDVIRATIRLAVPVLQTQTINGIATPVVVRTARIEMSTIFASNSTGQERKDAIAFLRNALAPDQTQIYQLLVDAEEIW